MIWPSSFLFVTKRSKMSFHHPSNCKLTVQNKKKKKTNGLSNLWYDITLILLINNIQQAKMVPGPSPTAPSRRRKCSRPRAHISWSRNQVRRCVKWIQENPEYIIERRPLGHFVTKVRELLYPNEPHVTAAKLENKFRYLQNSWKLAKERQILLRTDDFTGLSNPSPAPFFLC